MVRRKLKSLNIVDYLIVAFFCVLVAITLVPIMNILSLSVSDNTTALHNMGMLLPKWKHIEPDAYLAVFKSKAIYTSFLMSILITATATFFHVATTICAGFTLSKKKLPGRNILLLALVFTMLFDGGLIPHYLAIKNYELDNTFWVMVIPGAVSGYSIVLMKNYIAQLPASMIEAAEIDGANPFYVLIRIIVPLSVPIIATLSLFCAVGKWNDWTTAYFYIDEKRWLWPFQNVLQTVVVEMDTSEMQGIDLSNLGEAFKNALIVISILPVTIIYLCTQKYLIKGLFIGSVKE